MPQGSIKKKAGGAAKKKKTQKKSLGPKKGGRAIKPKKGSTSSAKVVKKRLEIQIKHSIEVTAISQALKQEHKPLSLIKPPTGAAEKKKINRKKPQKGKK